MRVAKAAIYKLNDVARTVTGIPFFLSLVFLVALTGMAFPYGFPLFLPLVCVYFGFYFIKGRLMIKLNPGIIIFLAVILCYLWGIMLSGGHFFQKNWSDLINIAASLLILPIAANLNAERYQIFSSFYERLAVPLFFLLSVLSLYKFIRLLHGDTLGFVSSAAEQYPWGTSLVTDYNMFAFVMFAGLFAVASAYRSGGNKVARLFCLATMFTTTLAIIFSGSRRGWVLILLLLGCYALYLPFFLARNADTPLSAERLLKRYILLALIFILLVSLMPFINLDVTDNIQFDRLTYRFASLVDEGLGKNFSSRTERWAYGLEIVNEYSLFQLLAGEGFSYLTEYAAHFQTAGEEDYPHNPVISTLHYSGVFGTLAVLSLLLIPLVEIFRHRRVFGWNMLGLYLIALLFFLPSGNSIFSYKYFMILVVSIISVQPVRQTVDLAEEMMVKK